MTGVQTCALPIFLHAFPEAGGEYHIELTRDQGLDHMLLQVERVAGASADLDADLARAISDELHRRIMARIDVRLVGPGTLPRTFSKAKRVTDLRLDERTA